MNSFLLRNIETILFIVAIIGAVIYSIYFNRSATVVRSLSKVEKRRILDCQTGDYVKVEGQVKYVGTPLIAPFSGRPCSYYYVIVENYTRFNDSRGQKEMGRWHIIKEEEYGNNLVIVDGISYALIETENSKSSLKPDKIYHTGTLDNPIEQLKIYLEKKGIPCASLSNSDKSVRYKEGIIAEGETIAVAGKVTWKRKSEVKLEMPAERILVVGPDTKKPVYLSNNPQALKSN